jgi:hypothetical protein
MNRFKNGIEKALKIASLKNHLLQLSIDTKISQAYAKAAATAAARVIDPENPLSWQFSGFSQHGEDGITDYLTGHLIQANRFFIEIGSANGLENCSSWFAFARSYAGLMIEGNPDLSAYCQKALAGKIWNVRSVNSMVTTDTIAGTMRQCPYKDPDIFILDIDGIDFYILKKILELGYLPKIIVVEYNSAFGPDQSITIPYAPEFSRWGGQVPGLYYGVSIAGWKTLLQRYGYHFLTVESSGTNAFFIHQSAFPADFTKNKKAVPFLSNTSDGCSVATGVPVALANEGEKVWERQFSMVKGLPFFTID